MPKSRLVLLDANVVIGLFELKLFDALTAHYEILISETCIDEAFYYEDGENQVTIDLAPYVARKQIVTVATDVDVAKAFSRRFEPNYFARLDPGELESLAYLFSDEARATNCQICSGDRIVFRVLGNLGQPDLGVSLEELLIQMGRTVSLTWRFTKAFRKQETDQGFHERLAGLGDKSPTPKPKSGW